MRLPYAATNKQLSALEVTSLEGLVQAYFGQGIATSSMRSLFSKKMVFRAMLYVPLSSSPLVRAFSPTRPQITVYFRLFVCHLQVSAGLPAPQRSNWPRLQYALKGKQHCQPGSSYMWLPIMASTMTKLPTSCHSTFINEIEACICWATCCMGYYGFMYSSEFTMVDPSKGSTMQTVLNHADSSQPCRQFCTI